jgi:hypothetical protein
MTVLNYDDFTIDTCCNASEIVVLVGISHWQPPQVVMPAT